MELFDVMLLMSKMRRAHHVFAEIADNHKITEENGSKINRAIEAFVMELDAITENEQLSLMHLESLWESVMRENGKIFKVLLPIKLTKDEAAELKKLSEYFHWSMGDTKVTPKKDEPEAKEKPCNTPN